MPRIPLSRLDRVVAAEHLAEGSVRPRVREAELCGLQAAIRVIREPAGRARLRERRTGARKPSTLAEQARQDVRAT